MVINLLSNDHQRNSRYCEVAVTLQKILSNIQSSCDSEQQVLAPQGELLQLPGGMWKDLE